MKIKVFLDTNTLMDILAPRKSSEASALIFEAVKRGYIEAVLSTQSIIDASYALRKEQDKNNFYRLVNWCCNHINMTYIDAFHLQDAISSQSGDYEDDAQYACALDNTCDYFITNDKKLIARYSEVQQALIPCTPEAFVAKLLTGGE